MNNLIATRTQFETPTAQRFSYTNNDLLSFHSSFICLILKFLKQILLDSEYHLAEESHPVDASFSVEVKSIIIPSILPSFMSVSSLDVNKV